MTDNVAVMDGYKIIEIEAEAEGGTRTLHLLVREGDDCERWFRAWDMDAQEFVLITARTATRAAVRAAQLK